MLTRGSRAKDQGHEVPGVDANPLADGSAMWWVKHYRGQCPLGHLTQSGYLVKTSVIMTIITITLLARGSTQLSPFICYWAFQGFHYSWSTLA